MQLHINSITFNNKQNVLIPLASISHIIEAFSSKGKENTTWIHFQNGKSIHILSLYEDVAKVYKNYIEHIKQ